MPSHTARRFAVFKTGAKVSSSSSKPAIRMREWSASSLMTSTTSSMVMRPTKRPSWLMTGAETQSLRSNKLATSVSSKSAGMASRSVSITSDMRVLGSLTNKRVRGNKPM